MDLFEDNKEPSKFGSQQGGFGIPLNGSGEPVGGFGNPTPDLKPDKPKNLKKIVTITLISLGILGVSGLGFVAFQNKQKQEAIKQEQAQQIKNLTASLNTAVKSFSLLALQEKTDNDLSMWDVNLSYVNMSELRTQFVNKVGSLVEVTVMDDGSSVSVTYPNFEYIAHVIKTADADKALKLVDGLDIKSHTYKSDLTDAYVNYFLENSDDLLSYNGFYKPNFFQAEGIPKSFETATIKGAIKNGNVTEKLSQELDALMFSSEGFHKSLDEFSMVAQSKYGKHSESKEHALWHELLSTFNGVLDTMRKDLIKEEGYPPKEDKENEKPVADSSDDVTVKSFLSSKEEFMLIEPVPYTFEKPDAELEKTISHSWVGATFIASKDSDAISPVVNKGVGTYDEPLTIGTPFVTKMKGTDDKYHDVKVTLKGIKIGSDAIKDVLDYDEKNQGFTSESDLELATFTFEVENLENNEIEVNSEFTLSDSGLNLTPRTGNMFSMPERAKIPPRGVAQMADWVYAKDTKTLSLVWGKTFNRQFDALFMNVLGDEVYDTYGRSQDRVSKKLLENEAKKTLDKLKQELEDAEE